MSLVLKALLVGLLSASIPAVIWIFAAYANQQSFLQTLAANDYGAVWGVVIFFLAGFFGILIGKSKAGGKIFQRLL